MSPLHLASDIVLWLGVALCVLFSVGMAVVRDLFDRLHIVAAVTSVAVPLVIVSQALTADSWRAALKVVFIAALLVVTGPMATVATARARATERQRQGSS